MKARVYLLLQVVNGQYEPVSRSLRHKPGVTIVDIVEGPADVIAIIEASNRQQLAELTIQALASVETMTEDLQLLPIRDEFSMYTLKKPVA
jgi:hypothetical protein